MAAGGLVLHSKPFTTRVLLTSLLSLHPRETRYWVIKWLRFKCSVLSSAIFQFRTFLL